MRSARGRLRVLSGIFLASLLVVLFGSTVGAQSLTPTPAAAPHDYEKLWTNGCFSWKFSQTKPKDGCVFGDTTSNYKVAIVGDSHTSDLFAAFNRVAKAHHWKLYTFVKADCPFLDIAIYNAANRDPYPECAKWNSNVLAQLQTIRPNLTITVPFRWILPVNKKYANATATGASIGRMLAKLTGQKVVMVDSPYANFNVPQCVQAHGADHCGIPKSEVMSGGIKTREQEAARVAGGKYLNLTGKMCGGYPCRVVTGNVLEFRDNHHLTNTYAKAFWGTLNTALVELLGL